MELPEDKIIVFFDGVCNFCNGFVNFIISRDKKNKFLFAALQSQAGKKLLMAHQLSVNDFDTIIIYKEGKLYKKSVAAFKILGQLGFPWFISSLFRIIPIFISDFFYDFISRNRYKFFGKKESCMVPTPEVRAKFLE